MSRVGSVLPRSISDTLSAWRPIRSANSSCVSPASLRPARTAAPIRSLRLSSMSELYSVERSSPPNTDRLFRGTPNTFSVLLIYRYGIGAQPIEWREAVLSALAWLWGRKVGWLLSVARNVEARFPTKRRAVPDAGHPPLPMQRPRRRNRVSHRFLLRLLVTRRLWNFRSLMPPAIADLGYRPSRTQLRHCGVSSLGH